MSRFRSRRAVAGLVAALALAFVGLGVRPTAQTLTKEEMRQFLLTAKVEKARHIGKGITDPWRLTLSDGSLTHDAAFQGVDVRKAIERFADGSSEINFVDSYHFNLAAYALAELLGLDHMMPVTVLRRWQGQDGALSWWIDAKFDEKARRRSKLEPPDREAWNRQMHRVRVFGQLVCDTDRNLENVLITEDWTLWMIDFTRAFRIGPELRKPGDLERCDRNLLENLRRLTAADLEQKTTPHLQQREIKALLARRDRIVAHFEKLVAEKGEAAVLY